MDISQVSQHDVLATFLQVCQLDNFQSLLQWLHVHKRNFWWKKFGAKNVRKRCQIQQQEKERIWIWTSDAAKLIISPQFPSHPQLVKK